MSKQGWVECLATAQFAGAPLTGTVTATSILPSQAKVVFPNGYLDLVGKTLRVRAFGSVTAPAGNTTSTLQLDVRLSNTSAVVGVLANTGAMPPGSNTVAGMSWQYEATITARAVGNTANVMSYGIFTSAFGGQPSATGNGAFATDYLTPPNTAPTSGAFDGTQALQLDMFATWGNANATNSITLNLYTVEALN